MRYSKFCIIGLVLALSILVSGHAAAQTSIMALGDSITEGFRGECSYRRPLSQAMIKNACNVNFVGSRTTAGIDATGSDTSNPVCQVQNTRHQAVSGYRADQILNNSAFSLTDELSTHQPDIVLLHVGSNDIFQNQSIESTVDDVNSIIDQVFTQLPKATVVVANVIPWSEKSAAPALFPGYENPERDMIVATAELGVAFKAMVDKRADNGDAVVLVDINDGFESELMTIDGVHPNPIGEAFIANKMMDVLYDLDVCGDLPIDAQPPITYIKTPSANDAQLPLSPTLTGTALDEGGSGIDKVRIAIQNADGLWLNYSSGEFSKDFDRSIVATMTDTTNTSTGWSINTDLSEGDYRLFALALDKNGNQVEQAAGNGQLGRNQDVWTTRSFKVVDSSLISAAPVITSPEEGATLTPSTAIFTWTDSSMPVSEWWVYAGSAASGSEQKAYFSGGSLPADTTSTVVTGLPNDGSTVFITLWYKPADSGWQSVVTTYQAAVGGGLAITSPSAGATLESGSQTISWSANGEPVDEYWIYVGTDVGESRYYNSALGSATSVEVSGLPVDGSDVYVRLWYRAADGPWQFVDTTYTAVDDESILPVLADTGGPTISSTQLLNWSAAGTKVDEWWLSAGSTPRADDYYNSGSLGDATSATISDLPSGSDAFVTLWYRAGGGKWGSRIYRCSVE